MKLSRILPLVLAYVLCGPAFALLVVTFLGLINEASVEVEK